MSCLLELFEMRNEEKKNNEIVMDMNFLQYICTNMYILVYKENKEKKIAMHTILKENKQEKNKCVRKQRLV
jgi:hypothetical protein